MKRILVVEDSPSTGELIKRRLELTGKYAVTWLTSLKETAQLVNEGTNNVFFAALLDFNLPDSTKGETIKLVVGKNIPVIVFTACVSEDVREIVWSHNVVDYVLKEDVQSIDYILSLLERLEKNRNVTVLVADGDPVKRGKIETLLKVHHYDVLTTSSGQDTLKILEQNSKILLVVVASAVRDMDGLALVQNIRRHYGKEDVAVMGVVYAGDHIMTARFLKYGANQCICRELLLPEEFYCMTWLLIEDIEHIRQLRSSSLMDFLTGLYNRRYFFLAGEKLFDNAKRNAASLFCAMLDIDYFKRVNDTYGHEAGDRVLQHVSAILRNRFRKTDVVARIGGEEFCILAVNMDAINACDIFDDLCRRIESSVITLDDILGEVKITVSIGVTGRLGESLDEMLKRADGLLYEAKAGGRNRVICDL